MRANPSPRAIGLMARLISLLKNNSFSGNVLVLSGGMFLAQAITVLVSPILTRLYKPEDFGVLMVFGGLCYILLPVLSLRYEPAILLPEDDESAVNVLAVCLLISLLMSTITFILVLVASGLISELTGIPDLQHYLLLLPVSLLGAGIYQILNHWAMRKKDFNHIARTRVAQALGQVLTQVGLGLLGFGPLGLILGFIIGQVSGTGTLAMAVLKQSRAALMQISLPKMLWVLKRYQRFPLLSGGPALLSGAGLQLPGLMLAFLYGPRVAGFFSLSYRVLGLPVSLLGASVAQVFFAESAELAKKAPHKLADLYKNSMKNMFLIGLPISIVIALATPAAFPVIFGEEWKEAGTYVQILSIMFLMQFIANSTGSIVDVLERQDIHLLREVIRTVLIIGIFLIAVYFSPDPVTVIIMLSVAGSAVYGISAVLSWLTIKSGRRLYD